MDEATSPPTPNIRARAAAIRLGISRALLNRMCDEGQIAYSLVEGERRFAAPDLDAWLAARRREAGVR